jgi:hypothetical protein
MAGLESPGGEYSEIEVEPRPLIRAGALPSAVLGAREEDVFGGGLTPVLSGGKPRTTSPPKARPVPRPKPAFGRTGQSTAATPGAPARRESGVEPANVREGDALPPLSLDTVEEIYDACVNNSFFVAASTIVAAKHGVDGPNNNQLGKLGAKFISTHGLAASWSSIVADEKRMLEFASFLDQQAQGPAGGVGDRA